jgi:hypothetical protein
MSREKEEALEAAKLAAMVGGQMKFIDRMTTERTSQPANRIDINQFVDRIKNPNLPSWTNQPNTPSGYADPIPQHVIENMYPEPIQTVPNIEPQQAPQQVETISLATVSNIPLKLHPEPKEIKKVVAKNETTVLTRSDIDSIRNSLKGIDKTLSAMLELLKITNLAKNHD